MAEPVTIVVLDGAGRKVKVDPTHPIPVSISNVGGGAATQTVEGSLIEIRVTPTISAAGIYAAGDAIGGLLEFANAALVPGGKGIIEKIVVVDRDQELAPIDFVFFDRAFAATADNAPFAPSDADMANCIGHVDVVQTDYANFSANSEATRTSGLRMPFAFVLWQTTTLYGQGVVRSGPTYTATTDLTVKLTIRRL